jgi:hypothetical protein
MTFRSGLSVLLAFAAACGSASSDGEGIPLPSESSLEEHRYELPAAEVWAAAQAAMAEDGAIIETRRAASDGGEIVARRPEGHHVRTTATAVEPLATRVLVVVSPPNSELASMIQGRIAERLSLRKAQADLFGETSVETVYDRPLEACVAAVEETCRALGLDIVRRMTLDAQVRIEARTAESRTMRFSLRRIGNRNVETAVMFTAERSPAGALDRLRQDFERRLDPAGN